jgi:ubiquinone/menaquinone biosynthesis C-methylase UbiE
MTRGWRKVSDERIVMSGDEPPGGAQAKAEVAGVFGRTAPLYDRVGPRFFSHFGHRLVELAQIPGGARVLDVATGKGAVLVPAAAAVGPRGRVTGIDLSEAMVREAAREIDRLGLENVDVLEMDAEDLRFPDASFDCVLCAFAIFFFPRLDRALREMRRVLRPGGRIAVTTWDSSFDEEWSWFDELVEAHLPPEAETEQKAESRSPPPPVLDRTEGLEKVMTAAGFTDTRVVLETAEFVYPDEELCWSSLWSHGMREELERVEEASGPDGLATFKAAVLGRLRTVRQADGIHQSFPALFTLARKPQD